METNYTNIPTREISWDEFIKIGRKKIEKDSLPLVIQMPRPISNGVSKDQIVDALGHSKVALFKKPKDPSDPRRSVVTKIQLKNFFDKQKYNNQEDEFLYRVVSNIKNRKEDIRKLIGQDFSDIFDYDRKNNSANIWINYKDQFGRSHFDELENYNIQILGKKRFILFEPGFSNHYTRSLLKGFGHHSKAYDLDNVDFEKYPKLKRIMKTRREITLSPGQMLYLPIGWWHQVHPLGELNANINFWLHSTKILRYPYVFADAMYKALYRKARGLYDYKPEPLTQS